MLYEGMERILIPVTSDNQDILLIIHGMQLAERIGGTIYILEIDRSGTFTEKNSSFGSQRSTKRGAAWAAGKQRKEVKSEYFQVRGDFCEEIMNFCHRYRITSLVLDLTHIGKFEAPDKILKMINSLKKVRGCGIELIRRKH